MFFYDYTENLTKLLTEMRNHKYVIKGEVVNASDQDDIGEIWDLFSDVNENPPEIVKVEPKKVRL